MNSTRSAILLYIELALVLEEEEASTMALRSNVTISFRQSVAVLLAHYAVYVISLRYACISSLREYTADILATALL